MLRAVNLKDFESMVKAIDNTFEMCNSNRNAVVQVAKTLTTLESGCAAMYDVLMKHRLKIDELEKRIESLENAQNNS